MTFLEIVQKLQRRTATSGTLTSVATPTSLSNGIRRLVDYTNEAWNEIQTARRDWSFRWAEFSKSLALGSSDYDLNAAIAGGEIRLGTGPFLLVKNSDTAIRREIRLLDKAYFDECYPLKNQALLAAGMPVDMTILPDGKTVRFNCRLDAAYTLSGPYFQAVQVMALDADVPAMPARYHDAIFWRALKHWAEYSEAADIFNTASRHDLMWETTMVNDMTPKILHGNQPLA